MSENVEVAIENRVMTVTLRRPERRNALSVAMYDAMTAALAAASTDPVVRVVVLRGSNGTFTSGNDLGDFVGQPPAGEDSPVFRFLRAISTFEKPVVAQVEGHAVGIGLTVLLHCDLVYVADDAKLQTPFTKLGVVPEAGSSLLLPRMMGHVQAARLLLLSDRIDGPTAVSMGIATQSAPADQLGAIVADAAARLAALPPGAVRASKRLMKAHTADALAATLATEGEEFVARLASPEAMEAFMAFMQKREPDFSAFE